MLTLSRNKICTNDPVEIKEIIKQVGTVQGVNLDVETGKLSMPLEPRLMELLASRVHKELGVSTEIKEWYKKSTALESNRAAIIAQRDAPLVGAHGDLLRPYQRVG